MHHRSLGALAALCLALFISANIVSAAAVIIPADKDHVRSLDGTWRFKLEKSAGAEKFQQPDYKEADGWTNIAVPGNWEMAGHSPATYNQPDDAVGLYRLAFDVPADWKGRLVRLNFDGVQNGAEIWLNGQPVKVDEPSWGRENYHEGGWTAFQVDLTPAVKFGERNLLAIRVTKKTKSADLDSGDYFFLGGVHRPVTLFSVPQTHIQDVTVRTKASGQVDVAIKVSARAEDVTFQIEGQPKLQAGGEDRYTFTQTVKNPRLWSAEHPNLYGLTIELRDGGNVVETVTQRIGIREVSIKDGVLLLNGVPIKMAGICRHDVSADEGTAVGPALWRKDIELMKAANINAIRTSHYPYGSGFYDLCDEMGMYVADELPYCWTPTDDKGMEPAFTQRARETVRRDKNHACVLIWAIGNENKEGRNLKTVADLVKSMDDTRPRAVSEFGAAKCETELSDSHYTTPDKIKASADRAKKVGHPHIYLENPNSWDVRLGADPGAWDAWAAVMQRTWDVVAAEPTLPGTFLWEWQDRAVCDKSPTKNYYFDERTGVHLLKVKGIVDVFRNPRPWYYHVKMAYSPIRVGEKLTRSSESGGEVSFDLENRYSFTDLAQVKTTWQLIGADGKAAAGSGVANVNLPPLQKKTVTLSIPSAGLGGATALRIDFTTATGMNIVSHQFPLAPQPPAPAISKKLPDGLAFPRFNLITRQNEKDGKGWRHVVRTTARLVDVKSDSRSLEGSIVMGEGSKDVVGRVVAKYDDGNRFSYRVDWTAGPKLDVQEIGWIFTMPRSFDRFSWKRQALWSVYPETHIGRSSGTARPDSADLTLTKMTRPDGFDFNSTKYRCDWGSLTDASGAGLLVEFTPDQRHQCRGGIVDNGYTLAVNRLVSPPQDISTNVVRDLYMTLDKGDVVEGTFTVGSPAK